MVSAGVRGRLLWDGLRTALDTGPMLARGAGHGWKRSLGDWGRSTTADGRSSTADGSGCRGRWWCGRCGLRRWWPSSAADRASTFPLAWEWDGSRWVREESTSPDIMSVAGT